MSTIWRDILVAWLHDPPDKALGISGHESRARRYLKATLSDTVSETEIKGPSDSLAAVAERLPAPKWQVFTVSPIEHRLTAHHPLCGAKVSRRELNCEAWDEDIVQREIEGLVQGVEDTLHRFLLLWRCLPERLAGAGREWFRHLPADTRVPDHTIWHHLDTTAALKAAEVDGRGGAAFLSFSLGPVQSFIAAARTVRDLWSGSMILAWLTFQAMVPVIRRLGPTALVYPALRGLPWLDLWLRTELGSAVDGRIPLPEAERLVAPCLPNRFLALIPWGIDGQAAVTLAEECRGEAIAAWKGIAGAVFHDLRRSLDDEWPSWSDRWWEQGYTISMNSLPKVRQK